MKKFRFSLPVSILKEGATFIAYTPTLDISTCADSLAEVQQNFHELVKIFFEELERKKVINEVLPSLGWQKYNTNWSPPVEVAHSTEIFELPMIR